VPGRSGWHDIDGFPDAEQVDGITVFRWEAPLFFANAGAFRQQVRRLARRPGTTWIVLQCEAITDIDVTAAGMLESLDEELNAQGVHVAFVEMRSRLQEMSLRYGLMDTLDAEHFYPSLDAALEAITGEDDPDLTPLE
jgi:MFS superfamily sulfate permease-like transporter